MVGKGVFGELLRRNGMEWNGVEGGGGGGARGEEREETVCMRKFDEERD